MSDLRELGKRRNKESNIKINEKIKLLLKLVLFKWKAKERKNVEYIDKTPDWVISNFAFACTRICIHACEATILDLMIRNGVFLFVLIYYIENDWERLNLSL